MRAYATADLAHHVLELAQRDDAVVVRVHEGRIELPVADRVLDVRVDVAVPRPAAGLRAGQTA